MTSKNNSVKIILAAATLTAGVFFDGEFDRLLQGQVPVSTAGAVIGRPLTPMSAAGVARRTYRRGAYIARIPAGCAYGSYYGNSLYHCGGQYYQKSGSGYVIVYF